jgi:hypothetical protein
MKRYGGTILGIYFGGCWLVALGFYIIGEDGVFLSYTSQSSAARQAINQFKQAYPQYELPLSEKIGDDRSGVTVEVKRVGKNSYAVSKIVENDEIIYRKVDTPEEFWYLQRRFGLGSGFTCNDIWGSSVVDISPQALKDFVGEYIAPLPLNQNNIENLKLALFYGAMCERYLQDTKLSCSAWREIKSILEKSGKTDQSRSQSNALMFRLPEEDRQSLKEQVEKWFCSNFGESCDETSQEKGTTLP